MKRAISILLLFSICSLLCACGQNSPDIEIPTETTKKLITELELSKEAYQNINIAYEITEGYNTDLYEVWRVAIFEPDKVREQGIGFLLTKVRHITEDDLKQGFSQDAKKRMDAGGTILTEEHVSNPDLYLSMSTDQTLWSVCPYSMHYAYEASGKVTEAQDALNLAKTHLRELHEAYPDSEYYANLKDYYTTTSAYLDLCNGNPAVSFEQLNDLTKEYEKEALDIKNELDFSLGE